MPAPGMRKTGSSLYRIASSKKTQNNNPDCSENPLLCIIVNAAAEIIPIMAGRKPLKIAAMAAEFLIFSKYWVQVIISNPGGKNIASVAFSAPQKPASLYPMKVALIRIGPGVICPKAIASANSLVVSHFEEPTIICCMVGIITYPPPKRLRLIPEKVSMILRCTSAINPNLDGNIKGTQSIIAKKAASKKGIKNPSFEFSSLLLGTSRFG